MKLCFVTVGATASFHLLLEAVLDENFLEALQKLDYTHLLIQYGKDSRALFDELRGNHRPEKHGIKVEGFDFNTAGLDHEMRMAQANPSDERAGGVIISHAGESSLKPSYPYLPSTSSLHSTPPRNGTMRASI